MQDTLPIVTRMPAKVQVRYTVQTVPEEWVLTEDTVPESTAHDDEAERIKLNLWAVATTQRRCSLLGY